MSNTRYLRAKDGTFAGSTAGATAPTAAPSVATAPSVAPVEGRKPVFAAPAAPAPLKTVADLKRRLQPGVTLVVLQSPNVSIVGVPRTVDSVRSGGVGLRTPDGKGSWLDYPKAATFTGDTAGQTFSIDNGGQPLRYAIVPDGVDVDEFVASLPVDELRAEAQAHNDAEAAARKAEHEARKAQWEAEEAARVADYNAAGHLCACGAPADYRSRNGETGHRCRACREKQSEDYRKRSEERDNLRRASQRQMRDALMPLCQEGRKVRVVYNDDSIIKVVDGTSRQTIAQADKVGRLAVARGNQPMLIPSGRRTRGYALHAPGNSDDYFAQSVKMVVDADTGEVLYDSRPA